MAERTWPKSPCDGVTLAKIHKFHTNHSPQQSVPFNLAVMHDLSQVPVILICFHLRNKPGRASVRM